MNPTSTAALVMAVATTKADIDPSLRTQSCRSRGPIPTGCATPGDHPATGGWTVPSIRLPALGRSVCMTRVTYDGCGFRRYSDALTIGIGPVSVR
jgi:hypothetical protein